MSRARDRDIISRLSRESKRENGNNIYTRHTNGSGVDNCTCTHIPRRSNKKRACSSSGGSGGGGGDDDDDDGGGRTNHSTFSERPVGEHAIRAARGASRRDTPRNAVTVNEREKGVKKARTVVGRFARRKRRYPPISTIPTGDVL